MQIPKTKSKLKILIILPRLIPTIRIDYNYTFPIGLAYISSIIKKIGYNVDCINLNHFEGTVEEILKKVFEKNTYDVVCTGHTGLGYPVTKEIVEATRKYSPNSKVILGGCLITSEPEVAMTSLKPDFGVRGEGEITILELLECIGQNKSPEKIRGIAYLDKNEKLIITENREYLKDIDSLPYPDFEGFEFEKHLDYMYPNQWYYNNQFDYPRTYPILCSRGCPFQCTFCYHSIGKKYRERSIKSVIEELEWATKKYRINVICIYDDMFSFKKERLFEFCDKIKELVNKTPWDIKWTCQLAVSCVDEKTLRKMKDSGCDIVSYGFESYSSKVLQSMKKPITPKQIDFAFKTTLKEGMSVQGNFIFGDIAETKETSEETLKYWKENCLGQLGLSFVQPYAGSEIYKYCIEKGIIKDRIKFMAEDILQEVFFNITDEMTDDEIHELYKTLMHLRHKYSRIVVPSYVKKMGKGHLDKRYEIHIKCPFCKQKIKYKNFYLQEKMIYKSYIICRNCNLRFFVYSPLLRILNSSPLFFIFVEEKYQNFKRKLKTLTN
ncbi:B12-binding domain-containing radical SAM protein [Nanoarchaeota archaeon]